ncbi:MAG TPA: ABC transporter ATP-binding protein, partial [Pyrinomonadaceae bacterium]|nr:ABC transporter ATP-binding protein [Pyrinomonadaceae bacterium]
APFNGLRKQDSPTETIWALKDVSFEMNPGEVVGIIGRNGAGKSTLLKILSRITEPTSGKVELYGRVGSLLEVGTGFHSELSGRENIFLNGSLLGMSRTEINAKFDEIVAFAEVDKFIDTPVKRYSSGMYVRLAFAVAAHLEPEILILDEVLAVGDVAFQKKCLGKMNEVSKEGRTVIFVSHNMSSIIRICSRCILINSGRIEADGPVDPVIRRYLETSAKHDGSCSFPIEPAKAAQFTRLGLMTREGDATATFDYRFDITVSAEYVVRQPIPQGLLGIRVSTADGLPIFTSHHIDKLDPAVAADALLPGTYETQITIPSNFLLPGSYVVTAAIVDGNMRLIDMQEDMISFDVGETGNTRARKSATNGVVNLDLSWDIQPKS